MIASEPASPGEPGAPGEPGEAAASCVAGEAMISDADVNKAVEALAREHEPAIMGYLRGKRKLPHHVAEEALNDTLLVMANKVRQGVPIEHPRAFMRVVAKNAAVDLLKVEFAKDAPSAVLAESSPAGDDMLDSAEISDVLRGAIRKLTPEHRKVVELRLVGGFNVVDTAAILDIPQGTVWSRLNTARRQLQELLRAEGIVRRSSQPREDTAGRRDT